MRKIRFLFLALLVGFSNNLYCKADDPLPTEATSTNSNKGEEISELFRDNPEGRDLEKALPLDVTLSERQKSIFNPINLDSDPNKITDLSLEDVLRNSIKSNLSQKIVKQGVIRDKWKFWNTTSQLLPDVFLSDYLIKRSGAASFSPTSGTPINVGTNYIAQFGIRHTLAPTSLFASTASYYDWMANTFYSQSTMQELLRQTANQYYEVLKSRAELAVRIEAVRQAKVQNELNEVLSEEGVGTKFAVIQTQEQLAENELALEAQQSIARISEVQLLNTINLDQNSSFKPLESKIQKRTLIDPIISAEQLIEIAYQKRPDLRRRKNSLAAARQRVNSSIAEFMPSLNSSYTFTSNSDTLGRSFAPNALDDFKTASLGVNWPIFDGLGLRQVSDINMKKAEAKGAAFEIENEKNQISTEVRQAYLKSQSADKQIQTAEKQLDAATEGVVLARIRLQNGVGTNIDLIDSQRNYVNALVNKVRAIIQFNQAQVDLLRAIGEISIEKLIQ